MSTIRILAVLLVFSVAVFSASGQTAKPTRVYVSSMPTGTQWTELQQHAYTAVKTHLDSLGVVTTSKQEEYVLFVDATEDRDQVAVSLLFGHVLPDEVVELSRKAEVMYSGLPADKQVTLPKDGKWVREMVTEDFMRQFVMPMDSRIFLTQKKDLQATLRKGVDMLYGRFLKLRTP